MVKQHTQMCLSEEWQNQTDNQAIEPHILTLTHLPGSSSWEPPHCPCPNKLRPFLGG
jgi:hypothetical protein